MSLLSQGIFHVRIVLISLGCREVGYFLIFLLKL